MHYQLCQNDNNERYVFTSAVLNVVGIFIKFRIEDSMEMNISVFMSYNVLKN